MNTDRVGDQVIHCLAEAGNDAADLALIHEGRGAIAALQLGLLLARIRHGLPAGRDSIDNLLSLASGELRR